MACYKSPSHPKCIDLILSKVRRSFQTTSVIRTGLSDFHLMALTVMRKSFFLKLTPRVINYSSYKHFSNEIFRESLSEKSQQKLVNNDYGFEKFCNITLKIPDKYAPQSNALHDKGSS